MVNRFTIGRGSTQERQQAQGKAKSCPTPITADAPRRNPSLPRRALHALIKRFSSFKHRDSSLNHSEPAGDKVIDSTADTLPTCPNQLGNRFPPDATPSSAGYSAAAAVIPATSYSEIYSRLMFPHGHGYPLYHPGPDQSLPLINRRACIRIGDVGAITRDGSFDFLFNVFAEHMDVNERGLPGNFDPISSVDISVTEHFPAGTHLLGNGATRTTHPDGILSYTCPTASGAVLELPGGATLFEARDTTAFHRLAALHAENWYRYMVVTRARDVPNGSLYLITGCIKAKSWGIAVFDRPSAPKDYLHLVPNERSINHENMQASHSWIKSGPVLSKIGPSAKDIIPGSDDEMNQCLFLRGYRIMLRQDGWDALTNTQAVSPQGRASPTPRVPARRNTVKFDSIFRRLVPARGEIPVHQGTGAPSTIRHGSGSAIVNDTFGMSQLIHPSDATNAMLLKLKIDAKASLTHDYQWCQAIPDQFVFDHSSLNIEELLKKVLELFETSIEHGCVSLMKAF